MTGLSEDEEREYIALGHELADEAVRRCRRFLGQLGEARTHDGGKIVLLFDTGNPLVMDPLHPLATHDHHMPGFLADMFAEALHRAEYTGGGR